MHKAILDVRKAIARGTLQQTDLGLLKGWPLLHFSEHASVIQQEGFIRGEPVLERLDCTYSGFAGERSQQSPGYTFAFNAAAWNVENDMFDYLIAGPQSMRNLTGMYAESALLFAGDGLYTRHYDEFNQVLSWGPVIDHRKALLLTNVGPQELEGEVVQDENGNDVDCWTLTDALGNALVSPGDHFTLVECVVKGVCHLNEQRLLSRQAIEEASSLYEDVLDSWGATLVHRSVTTLDEMTP